MIMFYIFVTLRATYTILASYTYDLIRGLGPINSLFYKSLVMQNNYISKLLQWLKKYCIAMAKKHNN